jgi:succinate dehydrogenase/fumarate reductase cytochrome b subunit
MPASKQSAGPNLIVVIFLAVAVLMLAIAGISAVSSGRALAREMTAPGTVVDFAIRQATDGTLYYRPVVAFDMPDGARRTLQVAEESTGPAYQVDEAVTIAYDPDQPDKARIKTSESTASLWILPLITGILGAAFLVATLFARWVLRSGDE